jgi:anthranilate phosphoribosyltransferase
MSLLPFLYRVAAGGNLSAEEAHQAMSVLLEGGASEAQIAGFLVALKMKGETAAELAGFVTAARETLAPSTGPAPDLDWPSYADHHRQLPYFVLAALLLARAGVRVLMHGIAGNAQGHVTTRAVLAALGVPTETSLPDAQARLQQGALAYVGLEHICPALERLFALRPLLGLRSPVNSLARALNPLGARCQMQGVFHPAYQTLHQETALLLAQPRAAVFKGGGGEAQRNPDKPCAVALVEDGAANEEIWPALATEHAFRPREEPQEIARVLALWRGEQDDTGAVAAITGTLAVALKLLGCANTQEAAQTTAEDLWRGR